MSEFQSKLKAMRRIAALGLSTAALAAPAYAQDSTTSGANNANRDIVVTAQGREQNLQDVPVSVSVVSGEDLSAMGITSLEDVATTVPSLNISEGPFDLINIRGVGSGSNAGFEQSVGTFLDGVYRSRSRSVRAALFDIERVEILKGPQTTFFGANSIAGAINITSRAPGDTLEINGSALYGMHDEYNFELGADLPVSDTLSFRLAGRAHGMGGYIKTRQGDAPNEDAWQIRASAKWNPSDDFQSDLRFDYGKSEKDGAFAFEMVNCPAPGLAPGPACGQFLALNMGVVDDQLDHRSDAFPSNLNLEFKEIAWTNTLDIGSSKITSRTAYYEHESDSRFTGIPFGPIISQVAGTTDPFPLLLDEKFWQFSHELRFQTDTGGVYDIMAGAYYARSELDFFNSPGFFFLPFGAFAAGIPGSTSLPTDHVTTQLTNRTQDDTYSAFAALTLRPLDRLTVNLGARYTKFKKFATRAISAGTSNNLARGSFVPYDAATQNAVQIVLGSDPSDFPNNNRSDDDFMPSASIQYEITDDAMVYASYAKGFKAGGFSGASDPSTFEPEYVDAYEVGIKSRIADMLTLNITAFLNKYDNLQETAILPAGPSLISVVRNAAKSETKGIELTAQLDINEYFSLSSSVTYLDAKYQSFTNAACTMGQIAQALIDTGSDDCTQNLSGSRRSFAPKWSGNISAKASIPVSELLLTIQPSMYFTSSVFQTSAIDPLVSQSSYAKVDLRVGIGPEDGKWNFAVIGRNLTDKTTGSFGSPVTFSNGSTRFLTERPLSVAGQISFKF